MAFSIVTSLGTSAVGCTGRPTQGHVQYAANQGAWWVFYLPSTTTQLAALYSTNVTQGSATWTAPTGSPYAQANGLNVLDGRNFAFGYANIAGTDILHASLGYNSNLYHTRFTLGTTWTNTNAESSIQSTIATPNGNTVAVSSTGVPIEGTCGAGGNFNSYVGSHADSGTAWTAGFGGLTRMFTFITSSSVSSAMIPLASGNMMCIVGNGGGASLTFTNLEANTWNGTAWSGASPVFGTAVTATDNNNWGSCARTTSDIHVVSLSNNSNAFVHARWNGSAWSAGDTIPTLAYGTTSGIYLASDGTSVWAFAIDTSNNIQYSKWVSGSGWGSWTVLEATRPAAATYITGCYSSAAGGIMVAWTEANGSNFNINGSFLSTSGGIPIFVPYHLLFRGSNAGLMDTP